MLIRFFLLGLESGSDVGIDRNLHSNPSGKNWGVATDDECDGGIELDSAFTEIDVYGQKDHNGHDDNIAREVFVFLKQEFVGTLNLNDEIFFLKVFTDEMCSPISLISSMLSLWTSSSSSLSSPPSIKCSLFVSPWCAALTVWSWILDTHQALKAAKTSPKMQTKKIIRLAAKTVIIAGFCSFLG